MAVKCSVLGTMELAPGFRGENLNFPFSPGFNVAAVGKSLGILQIYSIPCSGADPPLASKTGLTYGINFWPCLCWNLRHLHPRHGLLTPCNRGICKRWWNWIFGPFLCKLSVPDPSRAQMQLVMGYTWKETFGFQILSFISVPLICAFILNKGYQEQSLTGIILLELLIFQRAQLKAWWWPEVPQKTHSWTSVLKNWM